MINKTIHYCWFGGGEKTEQVKKCIDSWKKFCPDCQIIEWNETNYDVKKNKYMAQAYEAKRWGFVSDYARLDIIYEHGGVYLDTDVEVIKSMSDLFSGNGFIGFENKTDSRYEYSVNTGQGFGAAKHSKLIKQMLDYYKDISFFDEQGNPNLRPCPFYNTAVLVQNGLLLNNQHQVILDIDVYPSEYFCPYNWFDKKVNVTKNTYSIHHFDASWLTKSEKRKRRIMQNLDPIIHLPNRILMCILGEKNYSNMKLQVKKVFRK